MKGMIFQVFVFTILAVIASKQVVNFERPFVDFRSTTIWRAFILNAIAQALVIWIVLIAKEILGSVRHKRLVLILTTFTTSLVTFCLMNVVFGFGEGMTITPIHKKS